MRIGFIGNFIPLHSTENERKWSFEQLGHTVIPFQENQTSISELMAAIGHIDMLMYSHTHDPSYVIKGLKELFTVYKERGIPTVSAHLDRWLWLKRVEDMGKEATWFTEHIFMADCSPEAVEKYDELGLNWHFLPPAVVERECYMAEPDHSRFPHEIIFVGSKGYHPEYPNRPQLIDWLHETYGDQFGHYGNDGIGVVRGDDLNTLYASAKIVVGDSCFGGRPKYWSDRIPETMGRGGFLIHPQIQGYEFPGMAHYEHGNLGDLKLAIKYYLENDTMREHMRKHGLEWTKNNHTYTHRAKEILEVVCS